ncbi:MAG: hypothetical protein Aurels2KO_48720 [Aureliella sp.]
MNTFRSTALCMMQPEPLLKDFGSAARSLIHSPLTLLLCKVIIGIVSAYDIHQTIKYVEFLPQMELNPIGRWLMSLDRGPTCDLQQAACFITAKFTGNFACLAIIELVCNWRRGLATSIAIVVAAFQSVLLVYLLVGDN